MASEFLTSSQGINQRAISVVNGLDTAKFPLLLARIVKSIHTEEKPFNEDQELKLQTSLNLDADDVTLLLDTLLTILKQTAFHMAKPGPVLCQQLQKIGMENDKVKVFLQVWAENWKDVVKGLGQQKVTPAQLESINWRVHLKMTQATKAKMGQPLAVFDFGIRNNDVARTYDNVLLEFNHEELYAFSNQLDGIQSQLDALQ